MTFYDGSTALGSAVTLSGNTASLELSNLAVGAHTITASYGGDNVFGASVSGSVTETVGVFATTNKLTASAATVVTGASVTLTATLTAAAGTPTGTVTFLDGATTLGTGTLNASGITTFSTVP